MLENMIVGYLAGWLLTTIVLAVTVHKLQHPSLPQPHPLPLTVAGGALWPILLLGIVEYASVVAAAAVMRGDDQRRDDFDLDELELQFSA